MEGPNILYGDIDDLKQIHGALETQASLRKQISDYTAKKQELTKDVAAEEKLLREDIEATVKKRREQMLSSFDKEMSKAQNKLKDIRNDRNKAKSKGVEARIKEETSELIQENKNLRDEIRTIFRQKNVWKKFDNKLIYILYYPRTMKEKTILMLMAAMAIFIIPSFAVGFARTHWFFRMLLYVVIVAAFVGLYVLGYKYMRGTYKEAFDETDIQHRKMLKNEAKIKRIVKSIKKDKDEDRYGLSEFDEDIKEQEEHIGDIVTRKNEALANFEKTNKPAIEEEITERNIKKIEKLKKQLAEVNIQLKELETQQKNVSIDISTNYTALIGEENMTIERIEKMMVLLTDGRAKTIGDAVNILKTMQ